MKFHFQWRKTATLLILLSLSALLFVLSQFLLRPSAIDNQQFIPKNARNILRVNGNVFFDKAVYSLLFESKEQALLLALQEEISTKRKGKGKSTELGIDFLNDLFLFQDSISGGEMTVFIFHLAQPRKFIKNAPFFLNQNQFISVKGSTGLYLNYSGKKRSNKDLQALADGYLSQKNEQERFSKGSTAMAELELNHFNLLGLDVKTKEKISVSLENKSIHWKGKVRCTLMNKQLPNWHLKPAFTHFSSALISPELTDSLISQSKLIGMSLPAISHFSINYGGLLIQDSERLRFTPKMDVLIQFKEKTSRNALFNNPARLEELGFTFENNRLLAGSLTYFVDSLDERTFFIGLNRNSIQAGKSKVIFALQGNLSYLTQIDGGGFIGNIIQFNPRFKALQNFFSKLNTCSIVWENSNSSSNFSGELRFKNENYLMNEILRLYLGLK